MNIVPASSTNLVTTAPTTVGTIANEVAARTAHQRYQQKRAYQTRRRQHADVTLFAVYLDLAQYEYDFQPFLDALKTNQPLHDHWHCWRGITHGIVEAFVEWQQQEGYAIGSISVHLSTVKTYCGLAKRAGVLSGTEYSMIRAVESFSHREGVNLDKDREITRLGKKKATPTLISPAHAELLKRQKRPKDAAMMCLLLDIGLRVGELVSLPISAVNLATGTITFYREKVDKTQAHRLTGDCLAALQAYMPHVQGDYLFPGYRNKKTGLNGPMTTSAANKQVGILGLRIALEHLSPHDCRHYLFTEEVKKGTDIKTLQEMGGWASPIMPLRYATANEIVNSGASFFRQAR